MTKNPIKTIRNPNSPGAIQARLDGYQNTEPYENVKLITDPDAKYIFVDLTRNLTDQRINYAISGGTKTQLNKKLVRSSAHVDAEGKTVLTCYYTDVRNHQWVVIKSYLDRDVSTGPSKDCTPNIQTPRSTYGCTYGGFGASARGETWINQGKSVDKIHASQKRIFKRTVVETENQEKELVKDRYYDDFDGQR